MIPETDQSHWVRGTESRDPLASLSAAAAGMDGPLEEEENLLVTAVLAKEGAALFESRRYAECVDVLAQLLQKQEGDPKVLHNKAVAEYCRDGGPDPKTLIDVLDKIKKKSEDAPHSSGASKKIGGSSGSNIISGSKGGNTTLHQFAATNSGGVAYADEFDTTVVTFNIALILYQMHDYVHAFSVLEPLYRNIKPIDEAVTFRMCLLLLDTALASQDVSNAADVVQFLEKSFEAGCMINQSNNGSITEHQSCKQLKVPATGNAASPEASILDSSFSADVTESPMTGNLSDDALEYETLYSTLDSSGQNLTRFISNDLSKEWAVDLKLKLHVYKIRILLLTGNLQAAKNELNLAMNIKNGRDLSAELILKSQLEYACGNHQKASNLLMTSSDCSEPAVLSMFYNNLGCIHHKLGSPHTSSWYFHQALRNSMLTRSEKPPKLATYSHDKSHLIFYNCGLQYLVCGKPLVAARCFRKALPVFYNKPIFWLRFAECCLSALKKGILNSNGASSNGEEIKVHVAGSGQWRQAVVDNAISRNAIADSAGDDGVITGADQSLISLPFARWCLLNAYFLLESSDKKTVKSGASTLASEMEDSNRPTSFSIKNLNHEIILSEDSKATYVTSAFTTGDADGDSKNSKESNEVASSKTILQSSVAVYEDICRIKNRKIKQAVLGDLAYVELSLGNPLRALCAAKSLQQLPDCSAMYIFLSHVYAAEAFCSLNQPKEAAEQLSAYISEGKNVEFPYGGDDDREKWSVENSRDGEGLHSFVTSKSTEESRGFMKPGEARGTLYVNLAALSAMQGDLEQASYFAKQGLASLPNHARAVLAAVYVDLLQKKTQEALALLRQCRCVKFLEVM